MKLTQSAGASPRPRAEGRTHPVGDLLVLIEAARAVEQYGARALRMRYPNLGPSHACVLANLLMLDSQGQPATRPEIERRIAIPRSSIGDAMKSLESHGLIQRPPGRDKRSRLAVLTRVGRRAAREVLNALSDVAAAAAPRVDGRACRALRRAAHAADLALAEAA